MATPQKFNQFVEYMSEGVINSQSDQFKIALTNSAPVNTNTVLANITQIGAGNGYSTGGAAVTTSSSAQTGGVQKVVFADLTFTANGGPLGPFRYAVLYDDTPTSPADPLVAYVDYGAALTLADGETFTVDFSATNGAFTLT